jgi:hypothetical protein
MDGCRKGTTLQKKEFGLKPNQYGVHKLTRFVGHKRKELSDGFSGRNNTNN